MQYVQYVRTGRAGTVSEREREIGRREHRITRVEKVIMTNINETTAKRIRTFAGRPMTRLRVDAVCVCDGIDRVGRTVLGIVSSHCS